MAESLVSLMEDLLECERKSNVEGLNCVLNSMLQATASKSHKQVFLFVGKYGQRLKTLQKTHEDITVRERAAQVVKEMRRIIRLHLAQTGPDEQKTPKNSEQKAIKQRPDSDEQRILKNSEKEEIKPRISSAVLTGRERTCMYCLNTYKSERGLNVHLQYAREAGCRQHGFDFNKAYGVSRERAQRQELRQSQFGF
mmetsp:Transcript_42736/g.87343  ORF Transcript_42736/g.87343 Transcript_42736/m.87343 type:complete len:196 (-) Transcript_42736:249-836(-)|eukprot:CAMPEP_0181290620 /NCGR_PEP_ID=MMETSP1101-20121128/1509_1 /TAXON_ID=46948 /ORGANISM="Rhodomonas abbreviata, Strain Caron Lab Isolate" /LENGTH=195 /DNA_ID=CAMNT_0023394913 /DNA_START=104 /DNA_END=691 /DNA_ORIENTATION=-